MFKFLGLCCAILTTNTYAAFEIVTLGSYGGVVPGKTSSHLIRTTDENHYLALDGGSTINGIIEGVKNGTFDHITVPESSPYNKVGYIFRESIKGYFLSHAHFDHTAGFIMSSTLDTPKPIYALPEVKQSIIDHAFNWKTWPNFSDEGTGFKLKKYTFPNIEIGKEFPIKNTKLHASIYPISHSGNACAMILVRHDDEYFAFFGDIGPDLVEKSNLFADVWDKLAILYKANKLKGLMVESSFANKTEDKYLFGHLTPKWLFKELEVFGNKVGGMDKLQGLTIMVQHIKPSFKKGIDNREIIQFEIAKLNTYGIKFLYLTAGESAILK